MESKRNGFIELCRIIFAMCVVSHHSILYQNHGHIPFIGGYVSCEFFFMLSGFFLMEKYSDNELSPIELVAKKVAKIYPFFLATWITSFLIAHLQYKVDILRVIMDFIWGIPQLLLLSMAGLSGGNLGHFDYVGTGWWLSAYVLAMISLLPFMKICKDKYIWEGGFAPLIAITLYGYIGFTYGSLGVVNERCAICYVGCLRAIAGICAGCFCHHFSYKIIRKRFERCSSLIADYIQVLLLVISLVLMEKYTGYNDLIQIVIFMGLISISFGVDTNLNRLMNNKVICFLGSFSMVIYITQSLAYMYPLLPYPDSWEQKYIMHIVYIILLSAINYLVVCVVSRAIDNVKRRYIIKNGN